MVKAFNNAGLDVKQKSERFRIDTTPPLVLLKPSISSLEESKTSNRQWDKSLIRVSWKFVDEESSIMKHIVSLRTHQNGHTPMEDVVLGNTDTFLINLEGDHWLDDGSTYFVIITCCNVAGLCSSSQSETLQIDSSPPHMGGFAYPMSWKNYRDYLNESKSNISLSWYGFVDQDSSVNKYFITVSKNFSGDELSNGIAIIDADVSVHKQTSNITLNQHISDNSYLIVSIWAQNNAGLNSSIFRATVFPLLSGRKQNQSGELDFEKHSCKIHSCNQDCTCSAVGKVCTFTKMTDCVNVNESDIGPIRYPNVSVYSGTENNPVKVSASSACLSGFWKVDSPNERSILRFEWSMGVYGQAPGDGIFSAAEKQWHDVGKRTRVVYCLPARSSLIHGMKYSLYVKAWYSPFEQFIFTSEPITIDLTPPQKAKGKLILDSNSNCDVDYDVINWMDTLTFCWEGAFRETHSQLSYFEVSLGTSVNGK